MFLYPQPYPQMQLPPQDVPFQPKKSGRVLIGSILAIIALVMIIISLVTPWWHVHASGSILGITYDSTGDYGVQTFSSKGVISGWVAGTSNKTQTVGEYNEDFKAKYQGASSSFASVFTTTFYITLIGIVMALLGVIMTFMAYLGKIKPSLAGWLLIIAFIFALLAPVLFAVQLPGACETDAKIQKLDKNPYPSFMGQSSQSNPPWGDTVLSWGPALGWYVMVIAMIILIIAEMIVGGAKQPSSPAPATHQPQPSVSQYPYYTPAPPTPYGQSQNIPQYPSQPQQYPQQPTPQPYHP